MTAFELSATELACGVSMADVDREACRALVTSDGEHIVLDPNISPALAGAAARKRAGGPVEFLWFNHARMPVYARLTPAAGLQSESPVQGG